MEIIAWIFTGLIVGAVAKWLMPGNDPGGVIVTILLGIAGALFSAFVALALGVNDPLIGWIFSIVGALALLFIYRIVIARRSL